MTQIHQPVKLIPLPQVKSPEFYRDLDFEREEEDRKSQLEDRSEGLNWVEKKMFKLASEVIEEIES